MQRMTRIGFAGGAAAAASAAGAGGAAAAAAAAGNSVSVEEACLLACMTLQRIQAVPGFSSTSVMNLWRQNHEVINLPG